MAEELASAVAAVQQLSQTPVSPFFVTPANVYISYFLFSALSSQFSHFQGIASSSRYQQLLAVIDEIGREIKPTYSGNKLSADRLRRNIVAARVLIRFAESL